ncbi:hypothetical protein [Brytella acorum]|uniref:Uncharacterized protein n=1 Tax=Brytella acorum TaxID=2959299 RepID=A0AA35Y1H0_9PROT|nr:hypothetical protein [Brytella acorum]MDF3624110.1 hypothetical protein [Brytella acorum]CAI9120617.1 hypothetical protein LMG32879_001453 [Brytella acorum]
MSTPTTTSRGFLAPLETVSCWAIPFIVDAAVAILEQQPQYSAYSIWSWPIVLGSLIVGYFLGPMIDGFFTKIFR